MKLAVIIVGVALMTVAGILVLTMNGPLYVALALFGGACIGLGLVIP